jgi:glycosyltransferase involved in cell wall biosynthesis
MTRPIRTLLFSTLYPSSARPLHGIFVETRLRELLGHGGVETRVVAPVPWFPLTDARHGERAAMARTPREEIWHGIDVRHPRYPVIPKMGMTLAPLLLAIAARQALQSVCDEGFDFDLIDAHYYYPDGVAAALLARWFGRPLVVTARGSDLNLIGEITVPRAMIRWAASHACASIAVSQALAQRLRDVGAPRVSVLRNGVDATRFRPEPQAQARQRLGLSDAPLLLTVGNLLEVKRHHLVIDALAYVRRQLAGAQLAIVGAGPLRDELEGRCRRAGLSSAVTFVGAVDQEELRWWYSAADLLVLASSREGWPNVLLEAMACGTPVVASRVGGVVEVVGTHPVGVAVDLHDAQTLADAVLAQMARRTDREAVRRFALEMSWAGTSAGQLSLFRQVLADASDAAATLGQS